MPEAVTLAQESKTVTEADKMKLGPGTGVTKGTGAMGADNFYAQSRREDASTRALNDYAQHLADNVIGYATYCPGVASRDAAGKPIHPNDKPMTFQSRAGHQRILNAHSSEPVYFEEDWKALSKAPQVRLSKSKLNAALLGQEVAYDSMTHEEITGVARNLGILDAQKDKTREALAKACLASEFGAKVVAENSRKAVAS